MGALRALRGGSGPRRPRCTWSTLRWTYLARRRGGEGKREREGKKSFVCTTLAREINGPLTRTETANSGPGGLFKKERKKRGRGKERRKRKSGGNGEIRKRDGEGVGKKIEEYV